MNKTKVQGTILVVDGNWYLHRSIAGLHTNRPVEDALPYHFLSMIVKDALIVHAQHILIAFDGDRVFRHKVYNLYKANRNEKKAKKYAEAHDEKSDDEEDDRPVIKDLYEYLPHVQRFLEQIGVAYFQPRKYEADDVLRAVATAYGADDCDGGPYRVVCGTQDKDSYQYVRGTRVVVFDSSAKTKDGKSKRLILDEAAIIKKTGLRPDQQIDYQTMIGDGTDGIPNIPGFTPARTRKILQKWGTIRRWYNKDPKAKAELDPWIANIRRNRILVTLVDDALPPDTPADWKIPKQKSKDKWLTRNYHEYHLFVWPKSKGLFARR